MPVHWVIRLESRVWCRSSIDDRHASVTMTRTSGKRFNSLDQPLMRLLLRQWSRVFVVADVSVRSPRKIFMCITTKRWYIYLDSSDCVCILEVSSTSDSTVSCMYWWSTRHCNSTSITKVLYTITDSKKYLIWFCNRIHCSQHNLDVTNDMYIASSDPCFPACLTIVGHIRKKPGNNIQRTSVTQHVRAHVRKCVHLYLPATIW